MEHDRVFVILLVDLLGDRSTACGGEARVDEGHDGNIVALNEPCDHWELAGRQAVDVKSGDSKLAIVDQVARDGWESGS